MSETLQPDFSRRSDKAELMDAADIDPQELKQTLRELAFINRWLGGYGPSLEGVAALLPAGGGDFSLLDVGTGGGDTPRRIADWARSKTIRARIEGIDLSETSVLFAREQSRSYPEIAYSVGNLFAIGGEGAYDIVHAALVLHHFPGPAAARALAQMHRLSRRGVVINDLHRHPLAYGSIKLLTGALSRNRLIRHDAALSVLRAFQKSCLENLVRQAGLPPADIRWRWPFRWRMVIPK